jgi:3'-phosphoadenosine 5'-phosphosulfate sulfotransferase (PAPS reductase)/FAD synthetase
MRAAQTSVQRWRDGPPGRSRSAERVYFSRSLRRLHRLALLWSLGKDSNVMIWIALKALFARVPFPVLHVDTGKKFPEMYAFRDRYAAEWNLDLKIEGRLSLGRRDRSDAASRRTFGSAQDRGVEACSRQIWLRRLDRRNPPRRGADARKGTHFFTVRC